MPSYSKQILSGSNAGVPIALTSASTAIHQTSNTANSIDEVWLWASHINSVSSSANVTVTIGPVGTTATTASFMAIYNGAGLTPLLPGISLTPSGSSNTPMEVRAFANSPGSSNLVNITGYVNRIV